MSLPIYVIGHKNPDTDSICAALALAELKRQTGINAVAARLGTLNPETKFILDKLHVNMPVLLTTARSTLEEIEIDDAVTIEEGQTIRRAWDLCLENHVKTLYVVDDKNEYKGMVTLGDVSKIQMQDLNITSELLKETPLENLVASVKGSFILKGNLERSGFVRIADKRLMERDLKGAIMVLNDHEDSMIKSMAKGCAVIVVAENFVPNSYIIEMAKQMGVTLISTSYNIMKIIQMIYRSIPVELIMTPANKVIRFNKSEYVEDVEREMLKTRHSSYPVVFQKKILGSVARYNLLKAEKKQFILVDHNEKKQSISDIETANIVEIVDHHRKLIAYGMISDTMNFNSPTCTTIDRNLAKRLSSEYDIDFDAMAKELFENTATIRGKEFKNILYNDVKEYMLSGYHIAVSQVFTFDLSIVDEIKEDFLKYMDEQNKIHEYDLMLMVITNVEGRGSRFLYVGKLSHFVRDVVEEFKDQGFVSRKKQIVPRLAQELA